jgi:O-antigen/teichoic acid export membrane protein
MKARRCVRLEAVSSTNTTDTNSAQAEAPRGDARPELEQRVRRSSLFTIGGYAFANGLRLVSNVVLARLLAPEMFGEMLLVGLLLLALGMFSDVGIGPCLVQSPRGKERAFVRTAFTIQALRGCTIAAIGILVAPAFAAWYGAPHIAPVLQVACATSLLQGFNSTKLFTATRELALGRKTAIELVAQLASIAVCVVWAWSAPSVWALVAGNVVQCAIVAVASHTALPGERDGFALERRALHELFSFGRWVFASTCVTFLALQADRLVLGKLVESLGLLGVYGMAVAIAGIPTILAGHLSGNVQFPLLAEQARRTPDDFAAAFLRQRHTLLLGLGVLLLGVFWFAPLFFELLYPVEYLRAGPIAQWLCVVGWFALLKQTADRVLLVRGATRALAAVNALAFLAKTAGAIIGFHLGGLEGFLAGLVIGGAVEQFAIERAVGAVGLAIRRQDLMASAAALAVATAGWQVQHLVELDVLARGATLSIEVVLGLVLVGLVAAQSVVRFKKTGLS